MPTLRRTPGSRPGLMAELTASVSERRRAAGTLCVTICVGLLLALQAGPSREPSDLGHLPLAPDGPAAPAGGVGAAGGDEWEGHVRGDSSAIADSTGRPRPDIWLREMEAYLRMPVRSWAGRAMPDPATSAGAGATATRPAAAGTGQQSGKSIEKPAAAGGAVGPTSLSALGAKSTGSAIDPSATTAIAAPLAAVSGTTWTQIGPAPLRIDQGGDYPKKYQGTGPVSGQVVGIAIDPTGTTDQTVYLATGSGGLWKTTNGGTSWSPLTDSQASASIGAVALDPSNASIVYAGSGNPDDGQGYAKGAGVYRSANGGAAWTVVGASILASKSITRIVVPVTGTVLVGTTAGLFRSTNANAASGVTFTEILVGGTSGQFISDLQLDTASPSTTIYVAVDNAGIWKSTNAGSTFPTKLLNHPAVTNAGVVGYSRIRFAQSRSPNGATMYALVSKFDSVAGRSAYLGLAKSTDSGANWVWASGPAALYTTDQGDTSPNCQCDYNLNLGVDPQDANRVYLGFQRMWGSKDGGVTFARALGESNQGTAYAGYQLHWDQHAFQFSPPTHWGGVTPTRLWVGNDGGVSTTADGGTTWSNRNAGIATSLLLNIDIGRGSPTANEVSAAGAQDTGIMVRRRVDAGTDWWEPNDGDGREAIVDPSNPARMMYLQTQGTLVLTTNGGATYADWRGTGATGSNQPEFFYRLAMPPTQPSTLFASSVYSATYWSYPGSNLYRRSADNQTFTKIASTANFGGSPGNITFLVSAPSNANVLYVGFDTGEVRVSSNALAATPTWSGVGPSTKLKGQAVQAIAVDSTNAAVAVVVYAGIGGAAGTAGRHVFRTVSTGATWTDISGPVGTAGALPDLPVYAVVIDPNPTTHTIIIGGEGGVMQATAYTGTAWSRLGAGLPTVKVTDLALDYNATPAVLRAATYGRSAWQLTGTAAPTISSFSPATGAVGTTVTINGTNLTGAFEVSFNGGTSSNYTVVSATQVSAVVPPTATTGLISVVTPGGTARTATNFTLTVGTPTISSVSPASGLTGTVVSIAGTNLTGATAVRFNGTSAVSFSVASATLMIATVPPGATTGMVTVTTPTGSATSPAAFTVTGGGSELIADGGFEAGATTPWTATSGVVTSAVTPGPRSGSWYAWLGGYATYHVDDLYQTITVPAGTSDALTIWLSVTTSETEPNPYDQLVLQAEVSTSPVTTPIVLGTIGAWSNVDAGLGYVQRSFDLTPYAGQQIRLHFIGTTDFSNSTSFLIDDVSVRSAVASLPPTISYLSPSAGAVGSTVFIIGSELSGATSVVFNGTAFPAPAVISSASKNLVVTTVPVGATNGLVTVTTPVASVLSPARFLVGTPTQKLLNAGFESGTTSWTATSGVITSTLSRSPRTGSWYAWLCGQADGATYTDTLYQTVTMPASYSGASLNLWLRVMTREAAGSIVYDTLKVQVRNSSGTLLATLGSFSNQDASSGYVQRSFNLAGYAGQTIRIYFVGYQDKYLSTDFLLDDLELNVVP